MQPRELEIECPECHAQAGEPCGNESHPERIQAWQAKHPILRKPMKRVHAAKKRTHRKAA